MKKHITILLVLVLLLIILTSCGPLTRNGLKGNYKWTEGTESLYKNVSWTPITSTKLSGLVTQGTIEEKKTEKCITDYELKYLRTEGGLCGIGYWLEINENNTITKIESLEKLKEKFAPIESEQEAMSYIAVINGGLSIENNILKGGTAKIENGYLVNLIHNNTFGCGQHEPIGVVYKITTSGEISSVAFEKEPFSLKPEICVD